MKGFNEFSWAIEEQLMAQSNVSSVCVVPKQDNRSRETPVLFITLEKQIDISIVKEYRQETLLHYKVPPEFIV